MTDRNHTGTDDIRKEVISVAYKILDAIMPSPASCTQAAHKLRGDFPSMTNAQLADSAIKRAKQICAAVGAGAGMFSSPLTAIPAAAADVTTTLKAEAFLIGVVAALFDPEAVNHPDAFKADIFAVLFPSATTQALSEVPFSSGHATTRTLIRRYMNQDLLKSLMRLAAKYIGVKLTQKALLTKAVPLIGGFIGAGWNWIEVQRVGSAAIRYYAEQSELR